MTPITQEALAAALATAMNWHDEAMAGVRMATAAAILAALPAQPDPALDVERLARALDYHQRPSARGGISLRDEPCTPQCAAAIAAAYDADKGER